MDEQPFEERVVVTGGSGLVGTALKRQRPEWVYLTSRDYDLTQQTAVRALFEELKPTGVVHLAARVGGIKANLSYPADFFYENSCMNTVVIHEAQRAGVGKLLACLSTCAFPDTVKEYPMHEEDLHSGPPAASNLAYGYAKRMAEVQIGAYRQQFGVDFISVSPSNLYGPNDNFDPQSSHLVPALITKFLRAKASGETQVELWGTGEPLRQQLYVDDLASILSCLFRTYSGDKTVLVAHPDNLSIRAIAETVAGVIEYEGALTFNGQMDGQFRKDSAVELLRSLMPEFKFTSLKDGVVKTVAWLAAQPEAVGS